MDGILRERQYVLNGILNGIDSSDWSPEVDKHIAMNYTWVWGVGFRRSSAPKGSLLCCCRHRLLMFLDVGFPLRPGTSGRTPHRKETLKKGKAACKAALQEAMGLPVRPDVPLIGFIGRLDQQKGADLILGAMHWLAGQDVQVVLLGSGRKDLETGFMWAESEFKSKV
jgi:starch synthase